MVKPITVYREPNATIHFINNLIKEENNITSLLTIIIRMNLSPEEEQFNSETLCYLCKHPLENDKVRDYYPLKWRYRGAAHNLLNVPQDKIHLLRKGIYRYEYVDNFQKFSETALPPAAAFYSTLSGVHANAEGYEHAENVWSTFKIKLVLHLSLRKVEVMASSVRDTLEIFKKLVSSHEDFSKITDFAKANPNCTNVNDAPDMLKLSEEGLNAHKVKNFDELSEMHMDFSAFASKMLLLKMKLVSEEKEESERLPMKKRNE
ncbi:gastrula zinc finger protein XlCGF57.1 [Nephila pilipes]|uniref:Gastrula zinc finger protein XlCGF57.1 n=1 Tax=Nephila pilipes TaxID=299642 RepID=A0A8X6NEK8_NEPPI|nr:gastrula zinc finger protein XlCGF57.1 [Nephila pilipes]